MKLARLSWHQGRWPAMKANTMLAGLPAAPSCWFAPATHTDDDMNVGSGVPPTPAAAPTRPVAAAEEDTAASLAQPTPTPSASIAVARPRLARLRKALRRLFRRP
ncbi:hypothetical protein [Streptomyces sp. NPDC046805]|uniref:hypothetical protein n=1 Tax=Streptomyces sp. NPDC046805 TaxID=3155134 RepID=UPI00340D00AD